MKLCDLRRTALFKYGDRSILILKIALPRAVAEEGEDEEFSTRFNSVYKSLAEEYFRAAEKYAGECGASLAERAIFRPLAVRVSWEAIETEDRRQKKEKRKAKSASSLQTVSIKRTLLIPRVNGNCEKIDTLDTFCALDGSLLS